MTPQLAKSVEAVFGEDLELTVMGGGVVIERVRGGKCTGEKLNLSVIDAQRLVELLSFSIRAVVE